jgi:hypothetical protein
MAIKAVEMVRRIRDQHYEQTKGLSIEEQIKFIRNKSKNLQKNLKKNRSLTKIGESNNQSLLLDSINNP